MKKFGTPAQRKAAADLMREIRAMWPDLKGNWDRRDWNHRAMQAGNNHLAFLVRFQRLHPPLPPAGVHRPMEELGEYLRRVK